MGYRFGIPTNRFYEHRIRMSEFDVRNTLRALAITGLNSKEKILVFNHLILLHRRVVIAQFKKYERRTKITAKLSDSEIAVIANGLKETGIYPYSKFPRKMQLYKQAIEKGIQFGEAWNNDVRERREEARRQSDHGYGFNDNSKDIAQIEEDRGYHREHGEWGRLFDQDGELVYEELNRGSDGWLYNDDGVRVERWRSEDAEEDSAEENDDD